MQIMPIMKTTYLLISLKLHLVIPTAEEFSNIDAIFFKILTFPQIFLQKQS